MENNMQFIVAVAMILNKEGKILLQKRVDPFIPEADGKWEFPGGKIKYGEVPEETVQRECKEEVGCDIKIKRQLPLLQSNLWKTLDGNVWHVLVCCFEAEYIDGEPKPLDKKVAEVGWFSKEEIAQMDILKNTKKFIDLIN